MVIEGSFLVYMAFAIGAGLVVIGGTYSISRVGQVAAESIARQPEAAKAIESTVRFPLVLMESIAIFALVLFFLITVAKLG